MRYSIKEISEISGVSARTLRYYDEINLLKPSSVNDAGYRYYGEKELMLLQQILFYKERGLELHNIKKIIYQSDFDVLSALEDHLLALQKKQSQISRMIESLTQTIASMKGECIMSNEDKFSVFKEQVVQENERKYGNEIRNEYGNVLVDETNLKIINMSQKQWDEFKYLEDYIREQLNKCVKNAYLITSEQAKELVIDHKKWLMMTWKTYTIEAHKGLASMYVLDERFRSYYDKEQEGCAEYLKNIILYWVEKLDR